MNLGKKIKLLRHQLGITQEQLAQALGITSQAVCKWENESCMPDIALLPEISALFGVTIDELFDIDEGIHIKRIDNMLNNEVTISDRDFLYAENYLASQAYTGQTAARFAELYNIRACMYRDKARLHAEKAVKADPHNRVNHSILCEAANGVVWDWHITNHHELIDFYYSHIRENPDDTLAYIWLMENLIADLRLSEAEAMLTKYSFFGKTMHYYRLKADICFFQNKYDECESCYAEMIKAYPDDWRALSYYADFYAGIAQYDRALDLYEKSINMQSSPRLIDNYLCIAHIYEIKKKQTKAIEAYERIIDILVNEHGLDINGSAIDGYKRKIAALQNKPQ